MTAASLATARSARTGFAGSVRLRPAPPLEPPFDDEIDRFAAAAGPAVEGQLALTWRREPPTVRSGPGRGARRGEVDRADARGDGPRGEAVRGARLPAGAGVWRGDARPATSRVGAPDGAAPTLLAAPPEHQTAARRFLSVGLEILNGYRPAGQLRSFCVPADAGAVIERFAARSALHAGRRRGGTARASDGAGTTAGRCEHGPARRPVARVRLRRLWVSQSRSDIAEATAVLDSGDRCWALAFRLERRRGTWLCTAVAMP